MVGDHARQARGLCFEDDIAESVRRAGKDEDICRSIGGRQILAREVAGEDPFGKGFFEFRGIRTVSHDETSHRESVRPEFPHHGGKKVEFLFLGNTSGIEQADLAVLQSALLPEVFVTARWREKFGVQSARQDMDPVPLNSARLQRLPVVAGIDVNDVHLLVEPLHVIPSERLHP